LNNTAYENQTERYRLFSGVYKKLEKDGKEARKLKEQTTSK